MKRYILNTEIFLLLSFLCAGVVNFVSYAFNESYIQWLAFQKFDPTFLGESRNDIVLERTYSAKEMEFKLEKLYGFKDKFQYSEFIKYGAKYLIPFYHLEEKGNVNHGVIVMVRFSNIDDYVEFRDYVKKNNL